MATVADLGRMVKQKYPGAYDDLPDDQVGLAVQRKYPGAYDDFTAAAPAAPAAPERSLLQRVGDRFTQALTNNDPANQPPTLFQRVTGRAPNQPGEGSVTDALKQGAAAGINTATSIGGAALGGAIAGPPGIVAGDVAGSYAGRRINVALGLEPEGTAGDVAAVALPVASRVAGLAGRVATGAPTQAAQEVVNLGEQFGVSVSTGDAGRGPLAKRIEVALEQVPVVGTAGFRQGQQASAKSAAVGVTERAREALANTPYRGVAELEQAAQRGNKNAQRILEMIANAGDDIGRVVQASGSLREFRMSQEAARRYDVVERLAAPLGEVPVTQTLAAVDQAIAAEQASKLPHRPTVSYLEGLRKNLIGVTPGIPSDPQVQPVARPKSPNDYSALRQLRSDLGRAAEDFAAQGNRQSASTLSRLKGAVERDLSTFAKDSGVGELVQAGRSADRFYRDQVIPFRDRQLAKALASATPDEIVDTFVRRGQDRAQNFFNALDQRGRAAVKLHLAENALQSGLDDTTGHFSPLKYAAALEKTGEANGVFFRGEDRQEILGLTKLFRHIERAGQYGENPPTGQRLIPLLLTGGAGAAVATGSPGAVVAGFGAGAGLRYLLTSQKGRTLLLSAANLRPGSTGFDNVASRFVRELTRIQEQPE